MSAVSGGISQFFKSLQKFMAFGACLMVLACGSNREINMIKPGDNTGGGKNCDQRCKLALDSRGDLFSRVALQGASWSELVLAESMEITTKGGLNLCIDSRIEKEDGKDVLVISSPEIGCPSGKHRIFVDLKADISKDSNGNVTKVSARPNNTKKAIDSKDFDYSFRVNTVEEKDYSITTEIRVNKLEVKRESSLVYTYTEDLKIISKRIPTDINRYSFSDFETEIFINSGVISPAFVDEQDQSIFVTDIRPSVFNFDAQFLTERSTQNRNPIDFKVQFELLREDESLPANRSYCGLLGGKYRYTSDLKKKASSAKLWEPGFNGNGIVEVLANQIKDITGNVSESITPCRNQIIDRMVSIARATDQLFTDFHGQVGIMNTKKDENKIDRQTGKKSRKSSIPSDQNCELLKQKDPGQYIPKNQPCGDL